MLTREIWPCRRVWCSWTIAIAAAIVAVGLLAGQSYAQETFLKELGWQKPESLQGLEITGFGQNVTGVFVNSENVRREERSTSRTAPPAERASTRNSLASERVWAQIDLNYEAPETRLFGQNVFNRLFLRNWFVYEPPYAIDGEVQKTRKAQFLRTKLPALFTRRSNEDFHNQFGIREVWWQNKTGPLTLYVGRQIVTWGESVSFRVADVLNPVDVSFGFGFANLEQSRLPRYMIHPILDLPNLGPLNSNFLEVAYMPGFDLLYTQVDYIDGRFDGQNARAGRVTVAPFPGTRFSGIAETRRQPGAGGAGAWFFRRFQSNPIFWSIPPATFENSDVGVRLHTVVHDTELAALFLYSHFDTPTPFFRNPGEFRLPKQAAPRSTVLNFRFPRRNGFGVTANRPIYLPGEILSGLPLVFRGEVFYDNYAPFQTTDLAQFNGVRRSDVVSSLVALDISNLFVGWISKTGPVNGRIEWNNTLTLDNRNDLVQPGCAGGCLTRINKNETNILTQVGSSWWNNDIGFTWTSIWNPDGNTLRMFPDLLLTPPWTNKYFVDVRYIGIEGTDRFAGLAGGRFKGKSQFIFTLQYNFALL